MVLLLNERFKSCRYSAKGPGGVRWSETLPIYFTFKNAYSSVINYQRHVKRFVLFKWYMYVNFMKI